MRRARFTADDLARMGHVEAATDGQKLSKYGVDQSYEGRAKRTRGGITFASLLEAERYDELMFLRAARAVDSFVLQPSWVLTPGAPGAAATRYRADFLVIWGRGYWPTWRGLQVPHSAVM